MFFCSQRILYFLRYCIVKFYVVLLLFYNNSFIHKNSMKKLLLSIVFASGVVSTFAQQDGQFTQFFRTKLNYNPAFAGSSGSDICAGLLGRSQWLGFGSKDIGLTPQTINGDIHAPLFQGKLGVGLNIQSDAQGHESTLIPTISLAYHYTFANQHKISGGLGIGLIQKSLDGAKLKPMQTGDQLIPTAMVNGSAIDLNVGVFYQIPAIAIFREVYAGLSATHINQSKVEYGTTIYNSKLHTYFLAGGIYDLANGSFTIEPNIFVKNAVKTSFDINVMTTYNGGLTGGLTYRNIDAFAILAGYKFTPKNSLMLSYDVTTSKLSQYSSGTVELSYRHCFGFKTEPPVKTVRPIYTPRFL